MLYRVLGQPLRHGFHPGPPSSHPGMPPQEEARSDGLRVLAWDAFPVAAPANSRGASRSGECAIHRARRRPVFPAERGTRPPTCPDIESRSTMRFSGHVRPGAGQPRMIEVCSTRTTAAAFGFRENSMARSMWSGFLSFGLVSVPVGLYSATADQTIHFNQLHKGTSNRIRYKKVDEVTGEEVPKSDIGHGYDLGHGEDVLILETMYFADEIRSPSEELDSLPQDATFAGRELEVAKKLVESLTVEWSPEDYHNTYRARVEEVIERKREGHAVVFEKERPKSNVIDLMAALEASVARTGESRAAEDAPPDADQPATPASEAKQQDLDEMTKAELLARAAELDIQVPSKMTKPELIEAIGDAAAFKRRGRKIS